MARVIFCLLFWVNASLAIEQSTLSTQLLHAHTLHNHLDRIEFLNSINTHISESKNLELKVDFTILLAKSLDNTGQGNQALRILEQMLLQSQENTLQHAKTRLALGKILYNNHRYAASETHFNNALITVKKSADFALHTKAINDIANLYHNTGRYYEGINLINHHLSNFEAQLTPDLLPELYHSIARLLEQVDQIKLALTYKLKKFEIETSLELNDNEKAGTLYAIAVSYSDIGQYEKAVNYFKQTYEIDKKSGDLSHMGHSLTQLSFNIHKLGDQDTAKRYALKAIDAFKASKSERNVAWAQHNLSLILTAQNKLKDALKLQTDVVNIANKAEGDYHLKNRSLLQLSRIHYLLDNTQQAKHLAKQVLKQAQKHDFNLTQIAVVKMLSELSAKEHNYITAYQWQKQLLDLEKRYASTNLDKELAYVQNSLESLNKDILIKNSQLAHSSTQAKLTNSQNHALVILLALVLISMIFVIFFLRSHSNKTLLSQKNAYLDQILLQRNKLFSQIAHDLSTPITAAKLQLEAMQYNISPRDDENLERLDNKLGDINCLVNDLAGIALLEEATFKVALEKQCLSEFSAQLETELPMLITQHTFEYRFTNLVNIDAVYIDPVRIRQVISNLLNNAIKYTHQPGTIAVKLNVTKKSFELIVEDSAPTISKQHLPHIFDHLYRAPNLATTNTSGHGIGLAIVKQIVALHKGDISAEQSSMGGVKITICLPHEP
ncbi:tetratricopeptide repeat-containing sensor histidine kinase [Pseudoalteromonas sp. MMG012]|uniref:ATP-binding protein n=1 Tax=Pseudoalteromonas sp. MMG012 TaxID=2822686 RepID=UPI001B39D2F5|nr:tetratricopeptide repeat-containing sensor histidine kinase [Pseudoalteromonas sp. MMG012]MBQ4850271.1 tetratricopeptide repeat-containing sensor histidine kinase [Pseudoalteromonas sp. MMG012]